MKRTNCIEISLESVQFGSLGNGITVWTNAREEHNDYMKLAHIDCLRNITWYKKVNKEIRALIEDYAQTGDPWMTATQHEYIFKERSKSKPFPTINVWLKILKDLKITLQIREDFKKMDFDYITTIIFSSDNTLEKTYSLKLSECREFMNSTWEKFPEIMLKAKAISLGAKQYIKEYYPHIYYNLSNTFKIE